MVTAILPSLTDDSGALDAANGRDPRKPGRNNRDSIALSVESQLTITPERFARSLSGSLSSTDTVGAPGRRDETGGAGKPSALAGWVGVFTGCGALVALTVFLPLPAQFSKLKGVTIAQAVAESFYVVAAVAVLVALFVFVGLRDLRGEEGKGWKMLLGRAETRREWFLNGGDAAAGDASDEVRVSRNTTHRGPAARSAHH